jgi:hypothetical protein
VIFAYSCTYPKTGPTKLTGGTNTATANWDGTAFHTPDGSASGTADVSFTTPANLFNKTISVSDPMAPSNPLGTVTATDPPAKPASATFTYSKKLSPPGSGCQMVNNTATFTGSNGATGSSSQSVKDCALGGLTMGFWHNQNGQGILNGANQAALSTWLHGYNPFKDAPSSNIAGYFSTVFNAANAGGASANAMLKAQMLATALDVYFSDPSLGTNKIGGFNGNGSSQQPIGNALIDVSSWSAAFGGATQLTVSAMLTFENTVSAPASATNPLASPWYGQNKSLQTTAITAFNAVNNSQVTGP